MEDMVIIMKKIKWLMLVAITALLILSGCKHDEPKVELKPQEIALGGSIYERYGLGVEVDLSNAYVTITYSDSSEKKYNVLSDEVTYDEFDTSTVGSKTSIFICEGLSYEYKYEVVKYCLTLDFMDGTYDDASSLSIDAYNNRVTFSNVVPTPNDSQMQFAGWFYDHDLTKRVVTDIDDECKIEDNVTFYAGYDKNYDEDFEYIIKDGNVILTNYKVSMTFDDTITIPKTIKLYPVTEIGENFIDEMSAGIIFWIEKLNFEEGSMVKKIGKSAFENFGLTEVNFPDSIEIIDDRAFYNCKLTTLKLPKSLRRVGVSAFASLNYLLDIDFNDCALTTIDNYAFENCAKLVEIKLPSNVESIGSSAFAGCSRVMEFSIPKSVSIIGVNVFSSMPDLTKIEVEPGNLKFSTIDGNLYNKDQTIFYRYCYGKTDTSFSLPKTVKIIFESAFDIKNEKCSLQTVYLNEGLEEIASNAFQNTTFDFIIPSTVKSFAADSFVNWCGSCFEVSENNPNFKVINSSLVSADGTILYSVPANYTDEMYVVPNSIKTINSYAISSLNNVSVIKITSDSELTNIKEYGIMPFSLNGLITIIIEKPETFDIVDNGFKKQDEVALNQSFSIVISDEVIDKYLNAWAGYHFYEGDSLPLTYYVKTASDFSYELVEEIEYKLNVTTFAAYEKYSIFMMSDDLNEMFFNGKDILMKMSVIFYFDKDVYEAYDDYFSAFINTYAKYVLEYFDSLSLKEFGETKYRFNYFGQAISSEIEAKLTKENFDLFEKTKTRYTDLTANRAKVVEKIMSFELSNDEFSISNYNELMNDYNKYGVEGMTMSNNQLFKYFMIDFSYKMYQLSTMDYNYQNAAYLNNLLNGSTINNIYGINDYLLYYFNQDAYTTNLYKFSELSDITNNVNDLLLATAAHIDEEFANLDIAANYDKEMYQSLTTLYSTTEGFEYYLASETNEKYQLIRMRTFVNNFIDYTNIGLSKANMYEATITSNNITAIVNAYGFDTYLENFNEYNSYQQACDSYNSFFNETCNEFEDVLFAINKDNINEKFVQLKELYDQYPSFIALLSYNLNDEWVPMLTMYESIVCAKYINDVIALTDDGNITSASYETIFNLCFGYSKNIHIAGIEDLLNDYKNDNYFSTFLNKYIDSDQYMDVLNQL